MDGVEFARGGIFPNIWEGAEVDAVADRGGVARGGLAELLDEIVVVALDEFGAANDEVGAAVEPASGEAFGDEEEASNEISAGFAVLGVEDVMNFCGELRALAAGDHHRRISFDNQLRGSDDHIVLLRQAREMTGELAPGVGGKVTGGFLDVAGGVEKIIAGDEAGVWAEGADLGEGAAGAEEIRLMASGGPDVGGEEEVAQGARHRLRIVQRVVDDQDFQGRPLGAMDGRNLTGGNILGRVSGRIPSPP
jgi:hypothetical protein